DGDQEVVFVQNSETGQVQKITAELNQNNLRLIEIQETSLPIRRFSQSRLYVGRTPIFIARCKARIVPHEPLPCGLPLDKSEACPSTLGTVRETVILLYFNHWL